ncbi:MAG: MFS transporter [Candidatus Marinimicrobia bacterium]|nr:MFS transporter [Candidatus Neomarinimicrobiota bacterium]
MVAEIKKTLRESKLARWTALGIMSFTMFAGYLFTEILSPLKPLLETTYGWSSSDFGTVVSAYGWFNVFFAMLIIVGILLDKMGLRFSTVTSSLMMVLGASLKYYAFAGHFGPDATIFGFKAQIFFASFGYALFGVGVEYAGITVSKSIVKWFKGKEMATAMGMQVAIARLGSFVPLAFGAWFAKTVSIPATVLMGLLFLIIGFLSFLVYNTMDRKLDAQDKKLANLGDEDEFRLKDLGVIVSNRGFWYIALLCVLFYSAVFPFYKYGPDLMVNKFGVPEKWAGVIPSLVPFGTIFLTPLFGGIYDKKGKGASIMILGSFMLILVHMIFYLPFITSLWMAVVNAIILGIAFSLVPSAMWPSVPKIIPEKQLGSAYALIFWIQNWGLMGIPFIIGLVLEKTNPTISPLIAKYKAEFMAAGLSNSEIAGKIDELKNAGVIPLYNYETTWLIFIGLTLLALILAFMLKAEDKKKGYGLEQPNIEK